MHGNCFNNTPKPRTNTVKNKIRENRPRPMQQSLYKVFIGNTSCLLHYTKNQNSPVHSSSFIENTVKSPSQVLSWETSKIIGQRRWLGSKEMVLRERDHSNQLGQQA